MRAARPCSLRQWQHTLRHTRRQYAVRAPGRDQDHITTVADLKAWQPDTPAADVEVCGWVRSVRKSSGVRFVDVTDGSSMRPVQAVVDKALSAEIRPGAAVRLRGSWRNEALLENGHHAGPQITDPAPPVPDAFAGPPAAEMMEDRHASTINAPNHVGKPSASPSTVVELQVNQVEILGPSDPKTYPIQNKYQTPESLRTISHLRSRTPLNSTLLRFRSDTIALLTQFFFQEQFRQTHPPIITSSDCEGAGEAFGVKASGPDEFFRHPKYLTVSAQLHLESLAQALGNVWTLSPTFRAEQSDTSRHLSEFYMLEAEMSFVQDMGEVMDLVQRMIFSLASGLRQLPAATELESNRIDSRDPAERLAFEDLVEQGELQKRWRGLLTERKWPRITYTEAIAILQPVASQFEHKPVWGAGLQSEHEKYLAKEVGYDAEKNAYVPVFITQYPREIKAFYMLQSSDPPPQGPTVDCFDLLVPDLGELAGGSMREHRLTELQDNMKLHGLEVPKGSKAQGNDALGWYLDLRRWGCPQHGGFGMGFDRLLSYMTGVPNVRDVVPFPRHYGKCDC